MDKSKILTVYVLVFILLCSFLAGCSKIDRNSIQSSSSSPMPNSSPLESWIGNYTFSESALPDQNMFYRISLLEEDGEYYAIINIDGFQTIERLQAEVSGDMGYIELLFDKYLPDNLWEIYSEGDILLSLEKKESKVYTYWGEIQPILESNNKSGEIYFKTESPEN